MLGLLRAIICEPIRLGSSRLTGLYGWGPGTVTSTPSGWADWQVSSSISTSEALRPLHSDGGRIASLEEKLAGTAGRSSGLMEFDSSDVEEEG